MEKDNLKVPSVEANIQRKDLSKSGKARPTGHFPYNKDQENVCYISELVYVGLKDNFVQQAPLTPWRLGKFRVRNCIQYPDFNLGLFSIPWSHLISKPESQK